ncbi:MAG TPA: ABC transporter permease [Vicinamibacterales bacterium]|nr:ABC transporter permease [Vicinamibacterales bacterium]
MRLVGAIYRRLLLAYPSGFRERFGAGMEQALRDRYRAAAARGRIAAVWLLFRTVADVFVNAAAVRLQREDVRMETTFRLKAEATGRPMNWQSLGLDARYAFRTFRRNPVFTLLAVGALALGIGANTAIFTIVNGVLLKPLPYAQPESLVMVWSTNAIEHRDHEVVAPLDFLDYKKAGAFADLQAAFSFLVGATLTSPSGAAQQITAAVVSPGTFEMLGRAPLVGRTFTTADDPASLVVSHAFWKRQLGGDANAIGRVLTIGGQAWTVIGVMPADFVYPYRTMLGPSGFTRSSVVDGWLPMQFIGANAPRTAAGANLVRNVRFLSVIGRLKPGVSVAQADAEVAGIARQLAAEHADTNRLVSANVVTLHEQAVGGMRPALVILLGGVGFVLLMACVNLANLLLARSAVRQREMAIRSALGAARRRLIAQALIETMLLAMMGGAIALVTVNWGLSALTALAPGDMPRIADVRPDLVVLSFTFALSLLTGAAIGVVPALSASRPALQSTLKDSGRGSTSGPAQRRLRSALVVSEVALAVVLTLGAGLLLRSFLSVLSVDPGFRPDNLLTLQITVPPKYQTADQRRALYADLFARLESIPGVTDSGGTTRLPLGSTNVSTKIGVEGRDTPLGEWPEAEFRRAVHHYFETMEIPVMRGRAFTDADTPVSPLVVVINQTMARRMFPNEEPVGRRIRFGSPSSSWTTIVGVVGDVRHSGLEAAPAPEVYTWYLQNPPVNPFLVVRTVRDPSAIVPAVRAQVQALDKDISAYDIRPMAQVRSESISQRRFVLLLVAAFGALALMMAAVGVYGVMALIVSERTAEIGIRLALGAAPVEVLRMVVVQGVTLAACGVALGVVASLALAPLLSTQLFGIRALDPPTVVAVPALLLCVAAVACVLPARRAMTIDPVNALRS